MDYSFETDWRALGVYALTCIGVALLVLLLDLIMVKLRLRPESLLGLDYSGTKETLGALSLWPLGAGIFALLTAWLRITEISPQSLLAIAIGWPALMTRFVKEHTGDVDEQDG